MRNCFQIETLVANAEAAAVTVVIRWLHHFFAIDFECEKGQKNMESPLYLSLIGAVISLSYGILIWLSMCACVRLGVSVCS